MTTILPPEYSPLVATVPGLTTQLADIQRRLRAAAETANAALDSDESLAVVDRRRMYVYSDAVHAELGALGWILQRLAAPQSVDPSAPGFCPVGAVGQFFAAHDAAEDVTR